MKRKKIEEIIRNILWLQKKGLFKIVDDDKDESKDHRAKRRRKKGRRKR